MPSRPCSERWRPHKLQRPRWRSRRPSQRAEQPRFQSLRRLKRSRPRLSPPQSPATLLQSLPTQPCPKSGWSVQIASYDNVADADARVVKLKGKMKAYRVAALIRGKNWYRVKVGSYPSKDAAAKAH